MPLPINKPKLDSIVETALKPNSTQAITATVLQNSLYPIINSTFGLKTIWAGYISATVVNPYRNSWVIRENYYDPNYFPPVQETGTNGSAVINSLLNKYSLTNAGANVRADNGTTTGVFTNAPTIISTGGSVQDRCGQGLTFDGYVTGGVVTSLSVNNPGTGYSNSNSTPVGGASTNYASSVIINLGLNGPGTQPVVKFNLENTFYVSSTNSNNSLSSYYNIFIPNINTIFQYPNPIEDTTDRWNQVGGGWTVPFIQVAYNKNAYWRGAIEQYNTLQGPQSSSPDGLFTGGTINPDKPGIQVSQRTEFYYNTMEGSIEIKVPIINTTYTPV